jgi:hypothetical protein
MYELLIIAASILVVILIGLETSWKHESKLIKDIWTGKYPHIQKRKVPLMILEKLFMTVLILIRCFSLFNVEKLIKNKTIRTIIAEFYTVLWLAFLLFLLWYPLPFKRLMYVIVGYRLLDGLNYLLCIIFVDSYDPKWGLYSLNRSVILIFLNFFEIITGFAIFFLTTGSIGYYDYSGTLTTITKPIEALYLSTATITTLSYGGFMPLSSVGLSLAVSEVLIGFVVVVLIIGVFISGRRGTIKEIIKDEEPGK